MKSTDITKHIWIAIAVITCSTAIAQQYNAQYEREVERMIKTRLTAKVSAGEELDTTESRLLQSLAKSDAERAEIQASTLARLNAEEKQEELLKTQKAILDAQQKANRIAEEQLIELQRH